MKKLIFISLVILILYKAEFAQNDVRCPEIKFISPQSAANPGEEMIFSVSFAENKTLKLIFNWTVSAGQIINGQGTPSIKISTAGLEGINITGTVEIRGLPDNCTNTFSGEGFIAERIADPIKTEYFKASLMEEFARFDAFCRAVDSETGNRGYALMEIDSTESIKTTKRLIQKIILFIVKRGYDKNKLTFAIKREKEHRTEHILITKDTDIPECPECEIIRGKDIKVRISKKPVRKKTKFGN